MRLFAIIKWLFRKWQRTYLAGCALQGLLSNSAIVDNYGAESRGCFASVAREQADALIAELDKEDK